MTFDHFNLRVKRKKSRKQTDPQDADDARQREAVLQQTIVDLQKVLFNTAGLDRLANLTDEEWAEAEREDDNEEI